MKAFLLSVVSSNDKSLNNFLTLVKENFKTNHTNIIKIGKFVEKKEIVTILKSPHVNKTAQEQFEKRLKSVQIFLISENFNKTIISLKKVLNKIFSDIKLTIKYLTNSFDINISGLGILKNTNFKLYYLNKTIKNKRTLTYKIIKHLYSKKKSIKLKTYLNILNSHEEIV